MERQQYKLGENVFLDTYVIHNLELVSRICKELLQINKNNRKIGKILKRPFAKEGIQMSVKHKKNCSPLLLIRKMPVQITVTCTLYSTYP